MSTFTALFLAVLLTVSASSGAAPAAMPPGVDCSTLVLNLADCLSFVSAGSAVDKPEGTCCPGLKMVIKSHADCLCEAFKNSAQFGVTLNVSKALTLPAACHVSSPAISNCGLSLVAGGAPASAPVSATSPSTNAGSPRSSSGLTEAAAPEPALTSSGSIAFAFSVGFLIVTTVAVSFSF